MAIDVMKKVTLLSQVATVQRLIKSLHELGIVELIEAPEAAQSPETPLRRPETSTEESDAQLHKINYILNLLDQFVPEEKGFFEGLTPLPLVVDDAELCEALHKVDLEAHYATALRLDEAQRAAERALSQLQTQLRELRPFEGLGVSLADLGRLRRTHMTFGYMPARAYEQFSISDSANRLMAWEVLSFADPRLLVVAYLQEDEDAARRLLANSGFDELPLTPTHDGIEERIQELGEDIAATQERLANIRREIEAMATLRRPLSVLKAFWDSNRRKSLARGQGVAGDWVQLLFGYVREADLPKLQDMLRREFPDTSLIVEDPSPEDDVPVSITLGRFVKPIQLLIDLFGRPIYGTFDPSPFLIFNFYVFFGICFGDVFYGLLLIVLSLYLRSKTRDYPGVFNFSTLFMYAGISTVFFGALLGSWFGDLWKPEYLGEGNVLERLRGLFFAGMDPLERPLPALGLALAIGMLNQFYGIALKMYGAARNRDWATAIFDGLLWLFILPGLVLIGIGAAGGFDIGNFSLAPYAEMMVRVGAVMSVIGAVGLVLTQGRSEPGMAGKAVTGVISLYGILGTYGITAFIGDTLSYCRLLALGVTTSVVAMAINLMANMIREVPYAGPMLFVALLVVGHVFNFAISVLGAFIHSMRLIFVEFFGRFYEGGARQFRPLGFDSPEYIMKKHA